MKLLFRSFSLIVLLFLSQTAGAESPKRELRASWLTTVWGLDWPGVKIPAGGSPATVLTQKQQLLRILDSLQVAGTNAAFFQVRTECDAFYPSSYEPWSAYLVASRGQDPGWDPLAFAVEETHKRGMELHAWLNPYRFESVVGKYAGQPGDYRQTNPEWVLSYSGGGSILDPGNPEVRKRISDIVLEIVTNYDLDGVVFDDYFYAYGGTSNSLDAYSQGRWRPAGMDLSDWRRGNVNQMVADVYHTIQKVKPWVTFGVSPFGIWTVDAQVAAGQGLTLPSGITGMDAYKSIYCDPVAWLKEGTVDYISPQIYWPTTSTGQDYKILSPWWSDLVANFGRHLYVSHTLASLDASDYPRPQGLKAASEGKVPSDMQGLSMMEYFSMVQARSFESMAGLNPSEFGLQIGYNRSSDRIGAPGSVFFRSTMFFIKGFINYLRGGPYMYLSLPPVKSWIPRPDRSPAQNLRIEGARLVWDCPEDNVRYSVYAFPATMAGEVGLFRTCRYLLGISYRKQFDIPASMQQPGQYIFAVSVFDRNGNEFPPVLLGGSSTVNHPPLLRTPVQGKSVYPDFVFRWSPVTGAEYYILEVASDLQFSKVRYRREVTDTLFVAATIELKEDSSYYWRVSCRMAGTADAVSEAWQLKLLSWPKPDILYPLKEAAGLLLSPVVQWKPFGEGYSYRLQISSNNSFSALVFDRKDISANQFEIPPGVLFSYSTYYLRVMAVSGNLSSLWSDVVRFSTVRTPPSVPVILSPVNGESVPGPGVVITLSRELLAGSFTFQLSNSVSFPWNSRFQYTVNAPDSSLLLETLAPGNWYVKAMANYGNGSSTDWSSTVGFSALSTKAGVAIQLPISLSCQVLPTGSHLRVRYSLPVKTMVRLSLCDMTGRRMITGPRESAGAGIHSLELPCFGLSGGVYLLLLESSEGIASIKVIL